jgi:hypothetical protein
MIDDTGFWSVSKYIVFGMRTLVMSGKVKDENKLTEEKISIIY